MPRRKDLNNDFSAAERTTLVNLILQYLNEAVVAAHVTITHNDIHLFTGHRDYIAELERYLQSAGAAQFVPLPKWNPVNEVPIEFRVMKTRQDGAPWIPAFPAMPAVQNPNADPNRAMPAQFAHPTVCSFQDGNVLGNAANPWHGGVHGSVGGIFGQFAVASAVPLFWCWHAFVDEIYYDWQQCQLDPAPNYVIRSIDNGLVFDLDLTPGKLIQWDWHSGANQRWRLIPLPDGYYHIRSVETGLVLGVEGASLEKGAEIIQRNAQTDSDQWLLVRVDENNNFYIRNRRSSLVLDTAGVSSANEQAFVIQWPLHGGPNQTWTLIPES